MRIWGISSVYQRIDDIPVAKDVQRIYHGNWKPDPVLFYPIFFNYIVAITLRLISGFLSLISFNQIPDLYNFSFDHVLLISRIVSSLMGSFTIVFVYLAGKKLYSEKEAIGISFLFSVSFIHILYSHQIVLDVPMTFFYALSFYFCVLILKKGKLIYYLLASFFSGLAIATKYNGIFIIFSILLAHFLYGFEAKKRFFKIFLDYKIFLAGIFTVLGFFAGHPYALLRLKMFIKASILLTRLVHETEWYLRPIKPENLIEYIKFNKYVQGIWNIFTIEGVMYFILILFGIAWVFYKRSKENVFISLSGLIYFFGALGFLGFSRLRDLSTLSIFYSFFGMFGILFVHCILKSNKITRIVFSMLIAFLVISMGYRAFSKVYCIWEDDTTQIAERWIRRNVPEKSSFGNEWFFPVISDKNYKYSFFTRPYLFWRDFPPFGNFDFIVSTSACYSHFLKNQKYYPDLAPVYKNLNFKHELIKDFYFNEIEFKNPEVKIFNGKYQNRIKQRISLPFHIADKNPEREFEISDGSVYGKDINSFFIDKNQEVKRIFISRKKIPQIAIFIFSPKSDGEVYVKNFLLKKRIKVKKGIDSYEVIEPMLSFPFYKYIYKIKIKASKELNNAFIKLSYDEFDIALEFLKLQNIARAEEFFLKALKNKKIRMKDLEIYFYLAYCSKMLGKKQEAERYIGQVSRGKDFGNYLKILNSIENDKDWMRSFERFSGIDYELFKGTQTNLVEEEEFKFTNGSLIESEIFLNGKALLPSLDQNGNKFEAISSERRLISQGYIAELYFYNPSKIKGLAGVFEIIFKNEEKEESLKFPLILEDTVKQNYSSVSFEFKNKSLKTKIQFIVKIDKDKDLAFDYMKIYPDLMGFFKEKFEMFKEFIEDINFN